MLIPVILSGGAGTRLWPLSRELYPKQFLPLVGERTMIQETALRTAGLPDVTDPIVVCNEAHRFLVAEQLRQVGIEPRAIILEPVGRNTAPAVAVAALAALPASAKRQGRRTAPARAARGPRAHGRREHSGRAVRRHSGGPRGPPGDLRRSSRLMPRQVTATSGRAARAGPVRAGGGIRRETGCRAREGLRRERRLLLEQRHVPAARQGLPRRARSARLRRCSRPAARRSSPPCVTSISCAWTRRRSRPAAPIRSTTP